jgi:predicted HicB family RNase H-like nuclease
MLNRDLKYYLSLDYKTIIEKVISDDESFYIAYATELGKYACYGKGKTQVDAINSFMGEKSEFIEYLFSSSETIPEPTVESERFSGFFNVRTSPIIHASLVSQAKEQDISLNLYLNQILSSAVERKALDNQILDKIGELCGKIDANHYEVTRQLKYQNETIIKQYKEHPDYSNPYLDVA